MFLLISFDKNEDLVSKNYEDMKVEMDARFKFKEGVKSIFLVFIFSLP